MAPPLRRKRRYVFRAARLNASTLSGPHMARRDVSRFSSGPTHAELPAALLHISSSDAARFSHFCPMVSLFR